MSSTDELLQEIETDSSTGTQQSQQESESRRSRIVDRIRSGFSPKYFILALIAISIGLFLVKSIPLLNFIPFIGLAGIFLVAFLFGTVGSKRRYVEIGVAGGLVSSASFLSSRFAIFAMANDLGFGPLAAAGGAIGLICALVGHYFGRDLRSGLTADL